MQLNSTMSESTDSPHCSTQTTPLRSPMCSNCGVWGRTTVLRFFPGSVNGAELSSCYIHISLLSCSDHAGSFRGFSGNTEGVKHLPCRHLYQWHAYILRSLRLFFTFYLTYCAHWKLPTPDPFQRSSFLEPNPCSIQHHPNPMTESSAPMLLELQQLRAVPTALGNLLHAYRPLRQSLP